MRGYRRRRVAIASCYDKHNYGSMLQAYATQKVVEELGYEAVTIDKAGLDADISRGRRSYYLENLSNFAFLKSKAGFVRHKVKRKLSKDFGRKISQRDYAFDCFARDSFVLSPRFGSFSELSDYCSECDTVLVGSDQLWLPVNIAGDYYTLSFVGQNTKKVAYSTSFGVSSLPEKYLLEVSDFLESFDAVSVRELTGASIIRKACNLDVPVVCDPTMLLDKEAWFSIANSDYVASDSPYIFCYFLGKNIWNRQCARLLAEKKHCKIVALTHIDEHIAFDDGYADFQPYDVGPSEFLQLIANAEYVCTDSFHGTAFSCLFGRPFFSFRRHESNGSQSTNSRIDTLLEKLCLQDRACATKDDFSSILDKQIDFSGVEAAIGEYRSFSMSFLQEALRIEEGCDD